MLSAFDVLNFMPRQRIKKMLMCLPPLSLSAFSLYHPLLSRVITFKVPLGMFSYTETSPRDSFKPPGD